MTKIAVAQMQCNLGNVEANCERIASFIAQAADEGCTLVVLPEVSDVGYQVEAIAEHASSWSDIPFRTISSAAKKGKIHVVCGLSEKTEHGTFNTAAIVDSEGSLLNRYRKTHLFSAPPVAEQRVFTSGSELVTAELEQFVFGFSICFDLRFPELYRSLTLRGATALINCTAWPEVRASHWQTLTRARAIENQAYFIGANRVGTDGDMQFCGKSLVISPTGEAICEADGGSEQLLVADLDPQAVQEVREAIPVLQCRRSELYELE